MSDTKTLEIMWKSWKVKVLVAQLCLCLFDPMDRSSPSPSVHWILFLFFTVQVFIFTPIRPWIHREWTPTVRVPFHWSSRSVLLWVEQAGASAEPKSLSLWLPSFSDRSPSHILGAISALRVLNMLDTHINSLGKNLAFNLFAYNDANSRL